MQTPLRLVLILVASSVALPLGAANGPRSSRDTLFQIATLSELVAGDYDGRFPFRDVKAHGDFGLGTFDQLDGEMVAIDGKFFQVRADGIATRVQPNKTTPFAAVTFFEPDLTIHVTGPLSCEALEAAISSRFKADDLPYAIKVSGIFSELQTRSVPPQEKPYRPLDEALKGQIVFDFHSVEATMAGFWLPAVLSDINVAGFHFHALTLANTAGGHVLDCVVLDAKVQIDRTDQLEIRFGRAKGIRWPRRRASD